MFMLKKAIFKKIFSINNVLLQNLHPTVQWSIVWRMSHCKSISKWNLLAKDRHCFKNSVIFSSYFGKLYSRLEWMLKSSFVPFNGGWISYFSYLNRIAHQAICRCWRILSSAKNPSYTNNSSTKRALQRDANANRTCQIKWPIFSSLSW